MQVEVRLFATLRAYAPGGTSAPFAVELPPGAKVRDLLAKLGVPDGFTKLVFVNSVHGDDESELCAGDRVGLFPPVAGGTGADGESARPARSGTTPSPVAPAPAGRGAVRGSDQADLERTLQRAQRLGMFARLAEVYARLPETRCDNCARCCVESPGVFYVEHLHLVGRLRTWEQQHQDLVLRRSLAHFFFGLVEAEAQCPLLQAGGCLAYEHRPLACRLFGLVSAEDREEAELEAQRATAQTVAALTAHGISVPPELADRGLAHCDRVRDLDGQPVRVKPEALCGPIAAMDAVLLPRQVVLREFCFRPFAQRMTAQALGRQRAARLQLPLLRARQAGQSTERLLDKLVQMAREGLPAA